MEAQIQKTRDLKMKAQTLRDTKIETMAQNQFRCPHYLDKLHTRPLVNNSACALNHPRMVCSQHLPVACSALSLHFLTVCSVRELSQQVGCSVQNPYLPLACSVRNHHLRLGRSAKRIKLVVCSVRVHQLLRPNLPQAACSVQLLHQLQSSQRCLVQALPLPNHSHHHRQVYSNMNLLLQHLHSKLRQVFLPAVVSSHQRTHHLPYLEQGNTLRSLPRLQPHLTM